MKVTTLYETEVEGYYATGDGRIISAKNKNYFLNLKQALIGGNNKDKRYNAVCLSSGGKKMMKYVHRLELKAIDSEGEKATVDHIDRNRQNNNISNLRWADFKEQAKNRSKKNSK